MRGRRGCEDWRTWEAQTTSGWIIQTLEHRHLSRSFIGGEVSNRGSDHRAKGARFRLESLDLRGCALVRPGFVTKFQCHVSIASVLVVTFANADLSVKHCADYFASYSVDDCTGKSQGSSCVYLWR